MAIKHPYMGSGRSASPIANGESDSILSSIEQDPEISVLTIEKEHGLSIFEQDFETLTIKKEFQAESEPEIFAQLAVALVAFKIKAEADAHTFALKEASKSVTLKGDSETPTLKGDSQTPTIKEESLSPTIKQESLSPIIKQELMSPTLFSNDDNMSDADMGPGEKKVKVPDIDEAQAVMAMMETGGEEEFNLTTHLELTFDSNHWDDWEDDVWCMFFRSIAAWTDNLKRLTINIKGSTLFTRNNFIQPLVTYSEETAVTRDDKEVIIKQEDTQSEYDELAPPPKKRARKSKRARHSANSDNVKSKNTAASTPTTTTASNGNLKMRTLPAHKVHMHINEKAIVKELLTLHKPIPEIVIHGAMELGLRRHLISNLNPDWRNIPMLVSQAGYDPEQRERVAAVEAWEAEPTDMRRIDGVKQEPGYLGLNGGKAQGINKHGLNDWVEPTGDGGRAVMGWRVQNAKTFKGP